MKLLMVLVMPYFVKLESDQHVIFVDGKQDRFLDVSDIAVGWFERVPSWVEVVVADPVLNLAVREFCRGGQLGHDDAWTRSANGDKVLA